MKKIFIKLLCILSIMNFYACQSNSKNIQEKEILKMDKISNTIILEAAKKICTEKDCQFGGYGGYKPDGKVKALYLSLSYFKPIKIQEARELLVYSTNTFLNKINSSKELRPYLEGYPATEKNIELRISVSDDNKQIKPPYISYPAMLKGTCFYYIRNDKGRLELLHKETYAEAEQIVKVVNK
jgi:hypothetical protein